MLQSWQIAMNLLLLLVLFFSLCRQIYAVLYMCIMYTFFKKIVYILYTSMIADLLTNNNKKHEGAKYM